MAELDREHNKLIVKLVYYGPALSGKTTNLLRLHDILEGSHCGELMTFETKGDRTLFFDLLPLAVRLDNGFTAKIKLFTVPGQVAHDATRKAVLSRADGVVFVADSQNSQTLSNFQSFENLEKNARRVGLDFEKMPLVIQFNKRDLDDIVSEQDLLDRWTPSGLPLVMSSALHGHGVRRTFQHLLEETYRRLDDCFGLRDKYRLDVTHFSGVLPD
jgi:signal recognition particle receptor subunit beta